MATKKPGATKAASRGASKKPQASKPRASRPQASRPRAAGSVAPPAAGERTVLEVFPYRGEGLACLVVSSNADHDLHRSELKTCADFSADGPETVFDLRGWIYSMWMSSDDLVYLAHSGKALRCGPPDAPELALTIDRDVTRLCGAARGVYVIALGGYVGHFDGKQLVDLPVPDGGRINHVAEAADGTLYAAGDHGRLFRRERSSWRALAAGTTADLHQIAAVDRRSAVFCGAAGVCGRVDADEVTRFEAPADRDYRAVARFRDRVFFGAGRRGLDVLDGPTVVPFKDNIFSFHLTATPRYLFASGLNEAARFDGAGWEAAQFT